MQHGYLEVWEAEGRRVVPLQALRVSIGRGQTNDISLSDPRTSRLHAALENLGGGWVVRDLGSTNGTFLNGRRVIGDAAVHEGDEIRVGETRLVLQSTGHGPRERSTVGAGKPPRLTPREREVLVLLCAKLFSGSVFTQPASIREIAGALFVTEAAVKQHLIRLYDKFDIREGRDRRVRLANEAVRRGVLTMAELEAQGRSTFAQKPEGS